MAKLSSDGKSVTVEKGDTLWGIAKTHLGSGTKYKLLADINGIANPNLIYVGQVIKLSGSSSATSSSSNSNQVTLKLGVLSTNDNTLVATWTWGKESKTESYKIEWTYDVTGNGVWMKTDQTNSIDEDADANRRALARVATYSIPENARKVRVRVLPKSKKYKKDDKETTYWTANWSSYQTWTDKTPLPTPKAPSVKMEKYKLTAEIDKVDSDATTIEFQVYKNDTTVFKKGSATVTATKSVSYSCNVDAGASYKVRCRAKKGSDYSDWSEFSSAVTTMPATPKGITTIKANSETSVYLAWGAVATAETYDIEYATKKTYFDGTDQTTVKSSIEFTHFEITGLESGLEYFFRVRAVNKEGSSGWSDIKSVVIGKVPSAPTTWSSSTTVVTGEKLSLYWVHNSQDGSSQTFADLEIYIDGVKQLIEPIKNSTDEDEKDKTSVYVVNTSEFIEGTTIQWRVRTAGITNKYGDWSIQRTVEVYAPPTLELKVTNQNGSVFETLEEFPFFVYALAGPNTQVPTGYHLTITSNEIYETTDSVGNAKIVKAGDAVYSKYFDTSDALLVEMSAGNVDLENGVEYTVTCTVSMNSGLRAESTTNFTVSWVDVQYVPNAEIGIDEDTIVAHIKPYCETRTNTFHKVTKSDIYEVTDEVISEINSVYTESGERVLVGKTKDSSDVFYCITTEEGSSESVIYRVNYSGGVYMTTTDVLKSSDIASVRTRTGEEVYIGQLTNGTEVYYCEVETRTLVEDVSLSVYRREFDGSFTEIASGLDNVKETFITDPHPALDYARYRIVATTNSTGAVSYNDVPGYPTGCAAYVIQWDESWSNFDVDGTDPLQQPAWSGSLLRLPYNIDTSESNTIDATLVEYAGRKHPVSYYGTQQGAKMNWKTDIQADDKETLYQLRRLAIWAGDVYVREPSGMGYWATVSVSMSQTHLELTIPVTISVTRVEGGI